MNMMSLSNTILIVFFSLIENPEEFSNSPTVQVVSVENAIILSFLRFCFPYLIIPILKEYNI